MHTQVGIIGAGPAGAMAARTLRNASVQLLAFDKGRGPGGRCSTRRSPPPGFDHGAPVLSPGNGGAIFDETMQSWIARGVVAQWKGVHGVLDAEGPRAQDTNDYWVGVPGMNRIVTDLLTDVDIHYNTRVSRIERENNTWRVLGEDGVLRGTCDTIIIALPAVQAVELLRGTTDHLATIAANATSEPRWACLIHTAGPTAASFDSVRIDNDGPLSWVSRETSKPGRVSDGPEHWVVHGSAAWSTANLEQTKEEAAELLTDAWRTVMAQLGATDTSITQANGHRWRYALTSHSVAQAIASDPDTSLVLCGDWMLGSAVGDAIRSGHEAAIATLSMLSTA